MSPPTPLVSVVLRTYGHARFIAQAREVSRTSGVGN